MSNERVTKPKQQGVSCSQLTGWKEVTRCVKRIDGRLLSSVMSERITKSIMCNSSIKIVSQLSRILSYDPLHMISAYATTTTNNCIKSTTPPAITYQKCVSMMIMRDTWSQQPAASQRGITKAKLTHILDNASEQGKRFSNICHV
jgi:hypothetical protein